MVRPNVSLLIINALLLTVIVVAGFLGSSYVDPVFASSISSFDQLPSTISFQVTDTLLDMIHTATNL